MDSIKSKDIFAVLSGMENSGEDAVDGTKSKEGEDSYTLVLGAKNSGKTSLVMYFLNPTKMDEPKPTAALDYLYARRAVSGSNRKAVAHIWELATTKRVKELMCVPLSTERVLQSVVLIVLDLSIPGDVIPALVKWISLLRTVINDVLAKVPAEAVEKQKNEAMNRYSSSHPDRREVSPLAIPTLIVCSKFDSFQNEDSVKKKGIIQALRYIAHTYGATLLFTSVKDKGLGTQFRTVLNSYVFHTEGKTTKEVEATKGVFVPAGADTFEDIGMPKGGRPVDFDESSPEKRLKAWIKIIAEIYPPSTNVPDWTDDGAEEEKDDSEEKYPEPAIDAMRRQKREELRRYREKKAQQGKKSSKKDAKD
ncbi:Dynein 1b Light Intermediate Chain [Thraustotheca clavata]|uniref:Cytoplasmic dynein 2 light intermediate chain 1 n=1 Tax=Thraustotheca clavata TaxID=74557 RepID=A0A1V9YNW0_9STRA|nr:Dynein 1b Light Intermediate Chain [Thraustotheca clavata]